MMAQPVQQMPEPEWLKVSNLHTLRDQYTVLRKGMLKRYGLWTLCYILLFAGVSQLAGLTLINTLIACSVALLCPIAGLVDWVRTTHKIEALSAEIAKTGFNLRI